MLHSFKKQGQAVKFNQTFIQFYTVLEQKSKLFSQINSEDWKANSKIVKDSKGNSKKDVSMKFSIFYYADIMTHIMMLIDEKLLIGNDELIAKVKSLLGELLEGFFNVDIQEISQNMDQIYFKDLIYVINKSLTLISRLLSKNKNIRQPLSNPQYQIMSALSQFIEKISKNGQQLIKVVINLLKVSNNGTAK